MASAKAVYSTDLSRRLFYSAFFHGSLTTIVAAANGQYESESSGCGYCALLVFLTSINYWRHPVIGLRRTFDMLSSTGCFLYQLRASASAPAGACATYCGTSTGIVGCYAMSRHYNFTLGKPSIGCRWHLMVHACTGLGSVVLYDALGRNRAGWRTAESRVDR